MRGRDRAQYLMKIADLVKQNGAALAQLEAIDSGGTIRRCSSGDIGMVISTFRVFAELAAKEADEEALPRSASPPSHNYLRREPIGVCVGITPWNFPMQMAAWKIAPAIAAGNSIVLKPSPYASITTLELGRLILEAGLPDGVVNVVSGSDVALGEALTGSPLVDKIAFTGSTAVGRHILERSANHVTKCTLELGGKSAAIVLDDVDLETAVDGVIWGAFFHSGQVCSAGLGCCCTARSMTSSWGGWCAAPRISRSGPPWTRRAIWDLSCRADSSPPSSATLRPVGKPALRR